MARPLPCGSHRMLKRSSVPARHRNRPRPPQTGYKISFSWAPNAFFTNTTLTKLYSFVDGELHITAAAIDWKVSHRGFAGAFAGSLSLCCWCWRALQTRRLFAHLPARQPMPPRPIHAHFQSWGPRKCRSRGLLFLLP